MVRWISLLAGVGVVLVACAPRPEVAGRALYADYCAACHGRDARGGTGPDLTGIAARAGGVFPSLAVMEHVDGYARGRAGQTAMPEFGRALEAGPLVRVPLAGGGTRAMPERLVALAAYLEGVQE